VERVVFNALARRLISAPLAMVWRRLQRGDPPSLDAAGSAAIIQIHRRHACITVSHLVIVAAENSRLQLRYYASADKSRQHYCSELKRTQVRWFGIPQS